MKPFRIVCLALGLSLAHLGAVSAAGEAAPPAAEPVSCADSATGFVDGTACYSFGGRAFAKCPGCGLESAALLGPIPPDKLADRSIPLLKLEDPVVPLIYAPHTRRQRDVVVPSTAPAKHAQPGTIIVFRSPPPSLGQPDTPVLLYDGKRNTPVRGTGAPGAVTWGSIRAHRWYVAIFAGDAWLLL